MKETIELSSTAVLQPGQFLTGKTYTFGDDMAIDLSSGGTLTIDGSVLITVSQNNTVRDLTLQTSDVRPTIQNDGNDQPVGNLLIYGNASNSSFDIQTASGNLRFPSCTIL